MTGSSVVRVVTRSWIWSFEAPNCGRLDEMQIHLQSNAGKRATLPLRHRQAISGGSLRTFRMSSSSDARASEGRNLVIVPKPLDIDISLMVHEELYFYWTMTESKWNVGMNCKAFGRQGQKYHHEHFTLNQESVL